jgi:symplekin
MSAELSVSDQIRQLNDARKLVLADVKYYPTIIQGILPVIGANARVELRRWGANFLAEAFGTPAVPSAEKETMQLHVLDMMLAMLANPQEDGTVVGLLIQAAASIYPMALRWK